MSSIYFAPSWFFGYDIMLEILFAIVSLIVSLFAFRIYRKTSQKQIKLFGASFLLISISYLLQSIVNFLILSKLNENICRMIKLQSITMFDTIGTLVHVTFMTIGLAILVYTTFKEEKQRLLLLLITLPVFGIFLSNNALYMFYLFSTIMLIFISWHYIQNYLKNKQTKTLLVAIAFLFLLFSNFHFLVQSNHQLFYVIGHVLELIAYILISANLYLVLKK